MKIPKVRIIPAAAGWLATCLACGWEIHQTRRPMADAEAVKHQAKCAKGGAR